MAQILDLSSRFTTEQIEAAQQDNDFLPDLPAGGYVCKIIEPILNDNQAAGRANIELRVDIAEGEYKGLMQKMSDRFGFWPLRGYMSFKADQLGRFEQACVVLCTCNPGLEFNPFKQGGVDVDILKDKIIGVVVGKEEYLNRNGEVREKNIVSRFIEVNKIKENKFKIPATKKLKNQEAAFANSFTPSNMEEVPFAP